MKDIVKVFPLDNSPGYIINRLARELNACLYRAFHNQGYDITAQQWGVLNRLWEIEGLHQSELAYRTIKNRHNMARILAHLEAQGMIKRRPDRNDKRLKRVYLTDKGRSLQEKLIPIATEMLEQILAGISHKDIRNLRNIHQKITINLEAVVRK